MIKTLSKIYQFSGKMQGTMKKAILFSVLHSLFDMMSFGATFTTSSWEAAGLPNLILFSMNPFLRAHKISNLHLAEI